MAATGRVEETMTVGQGGGRGLARVWREREERGAARVRDGQKARLPPLERLPFIRRIRNDENALGGARK